MSHIFDALQKSIAEQPEVETPSSMLATELLEARERKTAAATPSPLVLEQPAYQADLAMIRGLTAVVDRAATIQGSSPNSTAKEPLREPLNEVPVDQLAQFQSLRILTPPNSRLVCITDKESPAAEQFRFLGVRLRQLQQNRALKKVLVTSTIPQEGKSTSAANLACVLAQRTSQRTLLIDGDLRRPSITKMFGLGKLSGITEWLRGQQGPMTSIYHLVEPGLWVLPAGDAPRDPLELMQSGRLSVLMEQLGSWFDWIVIDSPPVLPLADTSIWMRIADGILLVARQGTTEKEHLKRGLEVIDSKKLLGGLLNSSARATHNYYYDQHRQTPLEEKNKLVE